MIKHTQTIRPQIADELFCVFDHFVELALKGLIVTFLLRNLFLNACRYKYFVFKFICGKHEISLKLHVIQHYLFVNNECNQYVNCSSMLKA